MLLIQSKTAIGWRAMKAGGKQFGDDTPVTLNPRLIENLILGNSKINPKDEAALTNKILDFTQEIGGLAADQVSKKSEKILIYTEVEDGTNEADIIYDEGSGVARFEFCNKLLRSKICQFWEYWRTTPGNREWRAMEYVIIDGNFTIDLFYPDQLDPDEAAFDRRRVSIKKHFGDMKVDYSRPE